MIPLRWLDWLGAAALLSSLINFWLVIKHIRVVRTGRILNKAEDRTIHLSNLISSFLIILWAILNFLDNQ